MANSGELTPRQERAIAALLVESDIKAAAHSARVGYRTLREWLDNPVFVGELRKAQRTALDAAIRTLSGASGDAVRALVLAMTDEYTDSPARARAANMLLQRLPQLAQFVDLEERVSALEEQLLKGGAR